MGQLFILDARSRSLFSFTMLSAFSLLLAFKAVSPSALAEPLHGFGYVPTTLQNILSNTHGSNLYSYPTDLTRGIVPVSLFFNPLAHLVSLILKQKPIHSHNDYWHDIPFYSALSHGAISVEADVWLVNGTLYVSIQFPNSVDCAARRTFPIRFPFRICICTCDKSLHAVLSGFFGFAFCRLHALLAFQIISATEAVSCMKTFLCGVVSERLLVFRASFPFERSPPREI